MYQRIRDLREDQDLTQRQMGEILSCSQRGTVITNVVILTFPPPPNDCFGLAVVLFILLYDGMISAIMVN